MLSCRREFYHHKAGIRRGGHLPDRGGQWVEVASEESDRECRGAGACRAQLQVPRHFLHAYVSKFAPMIRAPQLTWGCQWFRPSPLHNLLFVHQSPLACSADGLFH